MSEMVDRVAKALQQVEFRFPGAGGLRGSMKLASAQAEELAKVAIETMRDPTRDMMVQGCAAHPAEPYNPETYLGEIIDAEWKAMIDAALR